MGIREGMKLPLFFLKVIVISGYYSYFHSKAVLYGQQLSVFLFAWRLHDLLTQSCAPNSCPSYVLCQQPVAQHSFGENHNFNVTMDKKPLVLQFGLLTELLYNHELKQCSLDKFLTWSHYIFLAQNNYCMTHIIIPIAAIFLTMFDTQLQSIPFAPSSFNNAKMEFGLIKPRCSPPAALAISSFQGYNGIRKGSSGHGNNAIASNQGFEYWPYKYGNIITGTGSLLPLKWTQG